MAEKTKDLMIDCDINTSRKPGISRFSKYKSMIVESITYDDSIKIQEIFSHVRYKSIQVESYLKESNSTAIERASTIESELDTSIQSSCGDVLQSSTALPFLSESNQELDWQVDNQKPSYLQQFSKLNSKTPNFMHPLFNPKSQMSKLASLIQAAIKSINHVFSCALRVIKKEKLIKVFSNEGDWLTLKFFLCSGWEKLKLDPCVEMMRPKQNFKATLTMKQIVEELELLLCKATRYEIAGSATQQFSQQMYKSIRQNFFEVEQKLIQCSNNLYSLWNNQQYPSFYYLYLAVLRGEESVFSGQTKQRTIREFRRLWQLHEPVTCSEIGRAVWEKLHI